MEKFVIVNTTFSKKDEAVALAKMTVEKKLAACAQLTENVESYYWWKDRVESDTEIRLSLKTTHNNLERLEKFILEHHSYETPEIVAVEICHASRGYGQWITDEVGGNNG